MPKPSKKEMVDLLNQLIGKPTLNEEKLDTIMIQAREAYQHKGPEGLFLYMRKLLKVPISDQVLTTIWKQMQSPEHSTQWMEQVNRLKKQ
ncbi:hypothetical protein SAMN05444392_103155 [Seinonella peptonophila]|uniref:Uncharacterized protein n=1 Tax=Seinonella peptonophila TaxID=112248 RepID=A0A1M4WD39_9BACL|nr:hypothetical protein [Seinonella peptonophila]SHE78983.1 hypothetical protein SAMN05444392_103155 [Seinonella peptonophila]